MQNRGLLGCEADPSPWEVLVAVTSHRRAALVVVATLSTMVHGGAYAQVEDWAEVAVGGGKSFEFKVSSIEYVRTARTGARAIAGLLRTTKKDDGSIEFEKQYVTVADCANRSGNLVTTDLAGIAAYQDDFDLSRDKSVADNIAEALCDVHALMLAKHLDAREPKVGQKELPPEDRQPAGPIRIPGASHSKDKTL